jgi:hypothetical protein
MEPPDPAQMHWRDRWEYEARREGEKYSKQSEAKLLSQVQQGNLGSYYQIWYVLGRKGTLQNAALVLLAFLQQHPGDENMLHRYHCSAALLKIIYKSDILPTDELRKQIQWDHEGEEMRQRKLLELRTVILNLQERAHPGEEQ